jgi:hypothetical protein
VQEGRDSAGPLATIPTGRVLLLVAAYGVPAFTVLCPGPMPQGRYRGGTASYGYYEEVRIIPDECLSQPGTLIGVGPGLCRAF